MPLYEFNGKAPQLPGPDRFWVAPGAQVIGDVILHEDVGIWFNAALRGDNEPISIGKGSNVQECVVIHTDPGFPVNIGSDTTIGHSAIIHGCSIGNNSLIGMGATVLNGAKIGNNCLVGANALVTEGKKFPDGSLIVGSPAKAVRSLDESAIAAISAASAKYARRFKEYRAGLKEIETE